MKILFGLSFFAVLSWIFVPVGAAVNSDSSPSLNCQEMLLRAPLVEYTSAFKRHAANEQQQCDWAFALEALLKLPRVASACAEGLFAAADACTMRADACKSTKPLALTDLATAF